jgi:hypothetical protein
MAFEPARERRKALLTARAGASHKGGQGGPRKRGPWRGRMAYRQVRHRSKATSSFQEAPSERVPLAPTTCSACAANRPPPGAKFIRSVSARKEIFERGHSLFNVVADETVDCRLCVVIEEF